MSEQDATIAKYEEWLGSAWARVTGGDPNEVQLKVVLNPAFAKVDIDKLSATNEEE